MKKFRVIMLAMLIFVMFISSAQAISISSVGFNDGRLSWTVSDFSSYSVEVDGGSVVSDVVSSSGSKKMSLSEGTHTLTVFDLNGDKASKTFTVGAAVVETPVPTAEPTAEPTAVPTAEPTAEPTEVPVTEAPATEAPATEEPTKAPATAVPTKAPATAVPTEAPTAKPTTAPSSSSSDSDVPKTGDATTTFLFVIVAAMALAAGTLTAVRVVSRRK